MTYPDEGEEGQKSKKTHPSNSLAKKQQIYVTEKIEFKVIHSYSYRYPSFNNPIQKTHKLLYI